MTLNDDDMQLLDLLTWRVRLATEAQLEEFQPGMANRVHYLAAAGFVHSAPMVVSVCETIEPLLRWFPGKNSPRFSALAYQLDKRRFSAPREKNRIFWAAARAVQLVGGVGGRVRQPLQVEHDLGTTQVFLRRRLRDPDSNSCWLGEDCLRLYFHPRGKIPDAVLCNAKGRIDLAIEFGGAYSAKRIRQFHCHCQRQGFGYELW